MNSKVFLFLFHAFRAIRPSSGVTRVSITPEETGRNCERGKSERTEDEHRKDKHN